MSKIIDMTRRLRPHVAEPWTMILVAATFAVAVFVVSWLGRPLRLEADGARFAWVVLIAFGMSWHGDIANSWRVMAGLIGGALAGLAGYYGALSVLPVTPMGIALGLSITAGGIALLAHSFPRVVSFAAAAVGFGVGVAMAGHFPLRPTSPAEDLLTLGLVAGAALAIGSVGSMALREFVLRMGARGRSDLASKLIRMIPHRAHALPRASGHDVKGAGR